MKSRKNNGSFSSKGYYIALILCAAAIGISGYIYYHNANIADPQQNVPTSGVDVFQPTGNGVEAVATAPTGQEPSGNEPTQGNDGGKKPLNPRLPVSGQTVMEYAMDCLSYNPTTRDWRVHNGIDIAAEAGTQVCASADGTVYTTYKDDTMGMTVVIRHEGGYVTTYASLDDELQVSPGDSVTAGQVIGAVGNTALLESAIGDHVHFSVTHNDKSIDPLDFLSLS